MRSRRAPFLAAAASFSISSCLSMASLTSEDSDVRLERIRQVDANLQAWLVERGVSMRQAAVRFLDERRGRGLVHVASKVSVPTHAPVTPPAPGRGWGSGPLVAIQEHGNGDGANHIDVESHEDATQRRQSRSWWKRWQQRRTDERSHRNPTNEMATERTTYSDKENGKERIAIDVEGERSTSKRFLCGCPLQDTIVADPILRERLSNRDIGDEWTVLATYVAAHKSLGLLSPLHPYLQSMTVPVMDPHPDADEDLALAIEAIRKAWRIRWEGGCKEEANRCIQDMLKVKHPGFNNEGAHGVTWDDFVWSQHMVRSRAVGLHVRGEELLCVVPGLDFANHEAAAPNATWQVLEDPTGPHGDQVWLVRMVDRPLRDGEEINVQYGEDKANQELLFNYGFAVPGNPTKKIVLHIPLPPPEEWDDLLQTKANLLMQRKMLPRVFLGNPSQFKADQDLPIDSMCVLAVLAAREKDLEPWLDTANSENALNAGDKMAAYTLLAWLLEAKIRNMEEKTGSAYEDQKLIDREGNTMDPLRLHHIIHRLEQKELAQEWREWTKMKIQHLVHSNASQHED